ncbi:MAG: ATP-binding protein [Sulfurimonas sp.]|nr:ATP-binding protein [Sulfurimonas sp.]MDD3060013.1 ATP-binding protein [Sulfurimonas sp.]MDD5201672.1 ATP-binding protein [Sulfurimonas sp.]
MIQNFHADTNLFKTLSDETYKDVYQPFVELVSNSYDADASKVDIRISLPSDNSGERVITIEDNGHSMDSEDLKNRFFNISVSQQPPVSPKGRKRKGNKGIGRLSGFKLGKNLKYTIIKSNQEHKFEVSYAKIKQSQFIDDVNIVIDSQKTTKQSGVTIVITEIAHLDIPIDTLKQKLLANFSTNDEFQIFINGQKLEPIELRGDKKEFEIQVNEKTLNGWLINSPDKIKNYGIQLKYNERAIGDVIAPKLSKEIIEHFYGEIDLSDLENIDFSANWDSLLDNELAKQLKEEIKKILTKEVENNIAINVDEEFKKNMAIPEYRHRIESLPSFSQKAAEKTIKDAIRTIKYNEKDVMKTIVELSIKSYEQNEVYEILKKLNNARKEDITKLAAALQQWGIKEVADVLTMLQQRFKVLDAFEDMINDKNTLELKGTHAVLAENIWIVDERYEWYISNKSLKTISNNILDSTYTGENASKRPDLFIKMQENILMRNEFLILELKKPGQKITFENKAQGERYANIINKAFTKEAFFNVYIVGSEYEEGIQRESIAGTIRTIAMSYQELVQEARARMIYIQKNLKEKESEIEKELYSREQV